MKMSLKEKKGKFKPRIKLNLNIQYVCIFTFLMYRTYELSLILNNIFLQKCENTAISLPFFTEPR